MNEWAAMRWKLRYSATKLTYCFGANVKSILTSKALSSNTSLQVNILRISMQWRTDTESLLVTLILLVQRISSLSCAFRFWSSQPRYTRSIFPPCRILTGSYWDVIEGTKVIEDSNFSQTQLSLIHRHQLFHYISPAVVGDDADSFRTCAILLRLSAFNHGIEGSLLGYLSPTILEFMVFTSYEELRQQQRRMTAGRLLRHTFDKIAAFDVVNMKFGDGASIPKVSPNGALTVFHPIDNELNLTPLMTNQTTETIMRFFRRGVMCPNICDFLLERIDNIIFHQYPHVIEFKLINPEENCRNVLETKILKACYDLISGISHTTTTSRDTGLAEHV